MLRRLRPWSPDISTRTETEGGKNTVECVLSNVAGTMDARIGALDVLGLLAGDVRRNAKTNNANKVYMVDLYKTTVNHDVRIVLIR